MKYKNETDLGFTVENIDAESKAFEVTSVIKNQAADRAGIIAGIEAIILYIYASLF